MSAQFRPKAGAIDSPRCPDRGRINHFWASHSKQYSTSSWTGVRTRLGLTSIFNGLLALQPPSRSPSVRQRWRASRKSASGNSNNSIEQLLALSQATDWEWRMNASPPRGTGLIPATTPHSIRNKNRQQRICDRAILSYHPDGRIRLRACTYGSLTKGGAGSDRFPVVFGSVSRSFADRSRQPSASRISSSNSSISSMATRSCLHTAASPSTVLVARAATSTNLA